MELLFLGAFRVQVSNHLCSRAKRNVDVLSDVVSHPHVARTDVMIARRDFITLHKADAILSVDVESNSTLGSPHGL